MLPAGPVAGTERRRRVAVVTSALASLTTATTFAPWASSGTRSRSSYAIVDAAERAGVLSPSASDLSGLWYFVPALCGLVLVSTALRRFTLGGASAATLGALAVTGGVLVIRSPLVVEPAAMVGTLAGACTVLAGGISLVTTKRRSDERSVGPGRQ